MSDEDFYCVSQDVDPEPCEHEPNKYGTHCVKCGAFLEYQGGDE